MPIADPALDLPLAGTPSSRFLTWTLAGLVGVAVLAFAVAAGADVALRRCAEEPRLVTVALPAATDAAADEAETRRALTCCGRRRAWPTRPWSRGRSWTS